MVHERSDSNAARAWRRLTNSRSARVGAFLVGLCVIVAGTAPWVAPYAPNDTHDQFQRPSTRHWLGTDVNRHDVLSRVVYGTRLSLLAGTLSIALAVSIGVPIGVVSGFFGGRTDALLMRTIDVALAFPSILLALLVATALARGWAAIVISVGLINVPVFARQIRATVMTMRELEFVQASRAVGGSGWHIMTRVILPGLASPVTVLATLGLGSAILEVAGLSFLGVGGDPSEPEWGAMLAQAKDYLSKSVWPALGPGAAISLTILGFNLLGDGLRDALDPR
ncbi:MAG TPA: ABC transporter permease [Pirellulaceae bacterium]|nr:ABC transporter permease [Pirellulaceae bacterium]